MIMNLLNFFFYFLLFLSLEGMGSCRWSTNIGEPLLFIKYDGSQLNILGVEKKTLALKVPIKLDRGGTYFSLWIFLEDIRLSNNLDSAE